MPVQRLFLSTAATVLALLTLGAGTAAAVATLRTDPFQIPLTGTTTLQSTAADPAVITTTLGSVTCNQGSIAFQVTTNSPSAGISGTLTQLTLSSCVDTFPLLTFDECALRSPGGGLTWISVFISAGGGAVMPWDAQLRCGVTGSTSACYYTVQHGPGSFFPTMTYTNAPSTLAYTGAPVIARSFPTDSLGTAPCGGEGTVSTKFTRIVQAGTGFTLTLTTS